ncbi:MAG: cob(I)yrinic acid a,c-diamide adenosyltransferase [Firmicutes bacterium]|nr:cob(I)yrinic acid a,c-diamide adenosyltransferase [Bacillota bacterium]
MENACIHIYYGDGKGKTTASVGLALRCCGRGFKVGFTSFLKNFKSGELINAPFKVFSDYPVEGFWYTFDEAKRAKVRSDALKNLDEVFSAAKAEKLDLLVLDEVLNAVTLGCLSEDTLIKYLDNKPEGLEVVMTGRSTTEKLSKMADYISEIRAVKHPYDRGQKSRLGIEE